MEEIIISSFSELSFILTSTKGIFFFENGTRPMLFDPYLTPHAKIQSLAIIALNAKYKSIELLKDNKKNILENSDTIP